MTGGPLPPYLLIAHGLRDRIAQGEIRPGDRLPSAATLAREHGVAKETARAALRHLQHLGLAHVPSPGGGTFVPGSLAGSDAATVAKLEQAMTLLQEVLGEIRRG